MTRESEVTTDPALVVGTPKAKTASLQRNSRILDRRTFRPSACLKNANKQTNLTLSPYTTAYLCQCDALEWQIGGNCFICKFM